MKKYILLLFMFSSSISFSQELMNFYLSPNAFSATTEGTVLMLHTTFFYYNGAGLKDYSYDIEGDVINFRMCYALGSSTSPTFDKRFFEIVLPTKTGDYTFNMNFYTDYIDGNCLYETIADSGSIDFTLPYEPIEKVEIDDEAFESYLEYLNFGDDEFGNGWVYKHKIDNITNINFPWNSFEIDGVVESLNSISHFKKLKKINIGEQMVAEISFNDNPELEYFMSYSGELEYLDVTNNPNLNFLSCKENNLIELDISNNPLLEYLQVDSDFITNLDLTDKIYLKNLELNLSQLISLNLTNNILLERLSILGSLLTSLDLSNNPQLWFFNISQNELLTEIDISSLTNLYEIYCQQNSLESLDLSMNQNLSKINLYDNKLIYLNIKNGNNEDIYEVITISNPNLFCIEVDHVDDINGYQPFSFQIDSQTEFSEDCP